MASHQAEPPPFQEAAHCDVCKCSFNTFRRRHHCRCCGRTLCNEHSSNQVALPQFGIFTSVRVCSGCFDSASRLLRDNASNSNVDSAAKKISKLSLGHDDSVSDMGLHPEVNAKLTTENTAGEAPQCKCGMPLCICEIVPDPIPLQVPKITVSSPSNTRSRKSTRVRQVTESTATSFPSSSIAQSLFFSGGQGGSGVTGIVERPPIKYEANGEGLREAIKNDDVLVVKRLLSEGVDANYCDKQGMSLLHLAALFNRTEIAFVLMDHGASSDRKNAQGETPLDCAPTMLQHKMRRKLEQNA